MRKLRTKFHLQWRNVILAGAIVLPQMNIVPAYAYKAFTPAEEKLPQDYKDSLHPSKEACSDMAGLKKKVDVARAAYYKDSRGENATKLFHKANVLGWTHFSCLFQHFNYRGENTK